MARGDKLSRAAKDVERISKSPIRSEHLNSRLLIPSGSTLLNLALSDRHDGGYAAGTMVNVIGDSSSGKTLLGMGMLAETSQDERFSAYRFIHDDAEYARAFDLEYLFGKKMADRLEEPPAGNSQTIQELQANIYDAIKEKRPFLYLQDSWDSLSSIDEIQKAEERIKAMRSGKEFIGSYHMEIARVGGQILRQIVGKINKTASLLFIIFQTRDNISGYGAKKKRSGGNAPTFYASHEIWLKVKGYKRKKERIIGVDIEARVSKNKLTGKKDRIAPFTIYYDYGVDDIGSMIDWMVAEGFWKTRKRTIIAVGLEVEASHDRLILHVEKKRLEPELRKIVGRKWLQLEEELKLGRKRRFE